MRVFFDSSSLAKRYIREEGSDKVEEILKLAGEVGLSMIAPAEVLSLSTACSVNGRSLRDNASLRKAPSSPTSRICRS